MESNSQFSGLLVEWPHHARRAPLTALAVAICVGVWLAVAIRGAPQDVGDWHRLGVFSGPEQLAGAWWSLLTGCFVHIWFAHLALNVYWLWTLGSRVERELGAWRYLGLSLTSGVVSSLAQALASDGMGIGYSGIGYALFGFAYSVSSRWPALHALVSGRVAYAWIGWLFLCVVLTHTGLLAIGNGAHAAGLASGMALGWLASGRVARGAALASALAAVLLTACFWRPWSPHWNYIEASHAERAGDFEHARMRYRAMIDAGGDEVWARGMLARLHHVRGERHQREGQLARIAELESERLGWVQGMIQHVDEVRAWAAATPDAARAELVRAALARAEGRLDEARQAYGVHLEQDPDDHEARLRFVQMTQWDALATQADIREALVLARQVEERAPAFAAEAREAREALEQMRR
ncbi:MAG: rhomboid family intramembrane serine protease [Planctomycetes bacterium]|nr:rhomboid family intramembrane serine protease [Planctomycetota bacterium]